MRNLVLLHTDTKAIDVENVKTLIVDPDEQGVAYVANDSVIAEVSDNGTWRHNRAAIVDCELLSLHKEVCIAKATWEVAVVSLETGDAAPLTFCEDGVEVMSWSPDQEVVAFVSTVKRVIVMNSTGFTLTETLLDENKFGQSEFMTVGWGKKETQFHGSEGKSEAKRIPSDNTPNTEDLLLLNQKISISWRGDSQYFAVSYVGIWGRMFKVFDKDGVLQFTSERLSGLEPPIAWRPSGNWIAVPHAFPDKYTIAFFEKNGLRHSELELPFRADQETVQILAWSVDSEILTVCTKPSNDGDGCHVYLYTSCNYHWYLKQTLHFTTMVRTLVWDPKYIAPKTLHLVTDDKMYKTYRWDYAVAHSYGTTGNDESVTAVIDGNQVLLTNFRSQIVPPPMCAFTLTLDRPINSIGFCRQNVDQNSNRFFTIDNQNSISLFDCEFFIDAKMPTKKLNGASLKAKLSHTSASASSANYYHWIWLAEMIFICCSENTIWLFEINLETNTIEVQDELRMDKRVTNITDFGSEMLIVSLISGEALSVIVKDSKFSLSPTMLFTLPNFCEQVQTVGVDGKCRVISLQNKRTLHIDDKLFATDVTSFFANDEFLAFTTIDKLKFAATACIDRCELVAERRIERGARLVVIVPQDCRTIFQMPRGNLECIQPRILSLSIIQILLDKCEYGKAYDILRKQRINLNLLVDHDPDTFIANLYFFVKECSNPQWLNLFISDLCDDDVSVTMYAENYRYRERNLSEYYKEIFKETNKSKVKVVCEQLCYEMMRDKAHFQLPIIASHVKRGDLDRALEIVWQTKSKDQIKADAALKYLLYLVDVNLLYDVALGMYNFGLVMFVASKSQKDPKEYVPFLNELRTLDVNYRKFKIDCHLKRFDRAVENIAKCGETHFDECMALIVKHEFYELGMRAFESGSAAACRIAQAYGDYLSRKNSFEAASEAYERANNMNEAIRCARNVLDWKRCVKLADKTGMSESEVKEVVIRMVPGLKENNRHIEASEILLHYDKSLNKCVDTLLSGHLYKEAMELAKERDAELIESHIKPSLQIQHNVIVQNLESDLKLFISHSNRLATVRQIKLERETVEQNHQDNDLDQENCDLFSDTSSMNSSAYTKSSTGTGKTFRSSKNRRKHERKLLSLKEGNAFEDIALIDSLYNLSLKSFAQQIYLRDVCQVLSELNLTVEYDSVEKTFATLLSTITASLDDIWIPEMAVKDPEPAICATSIIDYSQMQNQQHYSLIKPHQRCKPELSPIDWRTKHA